MTSSMTLGKLAVLALPALFVIGPVRDACEAHALARMAEEISPGTSYATALARFEAYAERSGPERGGDAILGEITPQRPGPGRSAPARILFIQDLWQDRDVAITAWFGDDERVEGVEFTCGI